MERPPPPSRRKPSNVPETPDVREQLAAYLAGELGADETAALEARMASEPWVAEAADDMADMLARMGRVDDVEPMAGFGDRLRDAIAEEIGHDLPAVDVVDPPFVRASGAAAADGWSSGPASRGDARRPGRRGGQRQRFSRAVMGVAAAVAVLFVGSTAVLLGGGLTSDDDAGDVAEITTRDMGSADIAADEAADEAEDAMDEAAPAAAEPEAMAPAPTVAGAVEESTVAEMADDLEAVMADEADAAVNGSDTTMSLPADDSAGEFPAGPEVLVLGELGDDADVRSAIGGRAAVERLLGRDAADGQDMAQPYADEIVRAGTFPDGTEPGACLESVLQDAEGVVVPAVAAQFTQRAEDRLGYALVRSSDGSLLDTVDVWVVDPAGCGVVAVVS